jgi:hypothetical protein
MSDDLVKRLDMASVITHPMTLVIVIREAAACIEQQKKRIEQLEAALDVIASNNGLALSWMSTAPMPLERYKDNCYEMMNIARDALGEEEKDDD